MLKVQGGVCSESERGKASPSLWRRGEHFQLPRSFAAQFLFAFLIRIRTSLFAPFATMTVTAATSSSFVALLSLSSRPFPTRSSFRACLRLLLSFARSIDFSSTAASIFEGRWREVGKEGRQGKDQKGPYLSVSCFVYSTSPVGGQLRQESF